MNFKNLLVSAAIIIVLIASAYVIYYDARVNPSLEPTWDSPIELNNFDLAKLPLESIYELPQGESVFRLWINPSFNHQSVIQIHFAKSDALLQVFYYQINNENDSLNVIRNYQRELSGLEVQQFNRELIESQFLHVRPPNSDDLVVDGSFWAIEANISDIYLSDAGREIQRDSFVTLRNAMINLTDKEAVNNSV